MRIAGRRIALLGFLLLSICFFLPQVEGCHEPAVPSEIVRDDGAISLLSLFAPFVFGLLGLGVYLIMNVARRAGIERVVGAAWCVLCGVFLLAVSVESFRIWAGSSGPLEGQVAMAGVFLTLALVLTIALRARVFRRLALCTLCCSTASLAYFIWWIVQAWGDLYYGIWLSATSCVLITAGALLDVLAPPPELVPSVDL